MSKKTIGQKIKQFRKSRNLTQDELAESLGYSGKSVIAHIEKGDADMTYEKILLLLRTYMIDANELFEVEKIDKQLNDLENADKKESYKEVNVSYLRNNLSKCINEAILDNKTIVVNSRTGEAVLISEEKYNSILKCLKQR